MDEYLMTVGKLTQHAGITDLCLSMAFRIVAGCDEKVGNAIYYSLESVHAKARMIRRVLTVVGDEEDATIVTALIDGTEKAHNVRNELAHAIIMMGMDGPTPSRLDPRAQKQAERPITPAYLTSLMKRSAEGRNAAIAAIGRLCAKRGLSGPTVTMENS